MGERSGAPGTRATCWSSDSKAEDSEPPGREGSSIDSSMFRSVDILGAPRLRSRQTSHGRLIAWKTSRRTSRAFSRREFPAAASAIMRGYGPAVFGYLLGLTRDEDRADDVFSQFCEDLWRGLPGFRRDSSSRTWVYTLAWHAWLRQERDAYRRHGRPLASEEMSRLAAEVRSTTARPSEVGGQGCGGTSPRATLARRAVACSSSGWTASLSWSEVAAVMSTPGGSARSPDGHQAVPAGEGQAPDARRGGRTARATVVLRRITPGANRSERIPVAPHEHSRVFPQATSPERADLSRGQIHTFDARFARHAIRSMSRRGPVMVAGVDGSHRRRPVSAEQQRRNCT